MDAPPVGEGRAQDPALMQYSYTQAQCAELK